MFPLQRLHNRKRFLINSERFLSLENERQYQFKYCTSYRASATYTSGNVPHFHSPKPFTDHLQSLIDDVINSINTIGYKAVDWVEQGLLETPLSNLGFSDPANSKEDQGLENLDLQVRHEIENGVHQFETLLEATIDKNFDKMEIFALRSIIAIPEDLKDWIRLRHYGVCSFPFTQNWHGKEADKI